MEWLSREISLEYEVKLLAKTYAAELKQKEDQSTLNNVNSNHNIPAVTLFLFIVLISKIAKVRRSSGKDFRKQGHARI